MNVSAGLVLIKGQKLYFYVDSRYTDAANNSTNGVVVVQDITELEADMKKVKNCGFESENVTVERLRKWKSTFKNTKFVQKRGIIEVFRREKCSEEIRYFRKAQRITKKMLSSVPKALKPGVTERGLAEQLRQWAAELGADELSFAAIVAFGKNSALPHHHPTNTKLKKRDIVQIDVGARYNGYCADQSAVFFVGKPTDEQKRVYTAVQEAQRAAIKLVKAGASNRLLDTTARQVLKRYDLEQYFVHSLGHGVGLDIHEGPSLSIKAPLTKLKKNEIITIEPGVYLTGKFGIRLEKEIIVM